MRPFGAAIRVMWALSSCIGDLWIDNRAMLRSSGKKKTQTHYLLFSPPSGWTRVVSKFLHLWPSQTDWNWLKLTKIDWKWLKMTENQSKRMEGRGESGWKPFEFASEISHGRWGKKHLKLKRNPRDRPRDFLLLTIGKLTEKSNFPGRLSSRFETFCVFFLCAFSAPKF